MTFLAATKIGHQSVSDLARAPLISTRESVWQRSVKSAYNIETKTRLPGDFLKSYFFRGTVLLSGVWKGKKMCCNLLSSVRSKV